MSRTEKSKAIWAASIIADPLYTAQVIIKSADTVVINKLENTTVVASTVTTESALLKALLKKVPVIADTSTMQYKERFLEITLPYFAGIFSSIDDQLPDGAWWQMHEDAANAVLENWHTHQVSFLATTEHFELPDSIDGNDIMHYYIANNNELDKE